MKNAAALTGGGEKQLSTNNQIKTNNHYNSNTTKFI